MGSEHAYTLPAHCIELTCSVLSGFEHSTALFLALEVPLLKGQLMAAVYCLAALICKAKV